MLPGHVNGFKLDRFASYCKRKLGLEAYSFSKRVSVSLKHILHLLLHHLSLEKVALDLYGRHVYLWTFRLANCGDYVNPTMTTFSVLFCYKSAKA
jgi:hypothetical protein